MRFCQGISGKNEKKSKTIENPTEICYNRPVVYGSILVRFHIFSRKYKKMIEIPKKICYNDIVLSDGFFTQTFCA